MTKTPEARTLERNVIQNNQFGLDGTDINGVDIAYDGNGTGNCFAMARRDLDVPRRRLDLRRLRRRERLQQGRAGRDGRLDRRGRAERPGRSTTHPPKAGFTPLEVFG